MITWIRPSGTEATTNDRKETIEYCKSLGWKEKGAKIEVKKEAPKAKKKTSKKSKD